MDRDDRVGGGSSNMVRSIQKEGQSVEYRADSTKQHVDHDDLTAQNVRRDTNKNMNSNVRAIKMKEETNAVEESYDLPSDEWVVESADDSGQEDGPISDEDEESAEIDELVDLSKSIASDETSNFWYLLRACALGEERIGRFILNGIDYVVMGEMAFECDAKTNLVDYSAKRKLKHTLLHTVEEVFLCYLYYTRGRFQAYARRLGKLRKRRIGAASAVRLEEYLYVRNARLPEFISGMFPPPTPIKLSEILRGEKLPDSGWNPITFHQKFHGIQEIRRVSNEPQNVIKNSGIHPDSDQPMKSSSIEQIETNGTEAVNDSTNSEIKRSDFSTSEVHKVEHKRTNGRTVLLEGTFYNRSCYVQFLSNWLCHMKKASHVVHSTIPLSMEQRSALGLSKNQATVAHTYMVIDGLPPSEFYGGGFGVTAKLANWAASREMVTRLYHGGLVTPSLYNEIEDDRPPSTRACKQMRKRKREQFLISKAALETLDQYLAIEEVPKQFLQNAAPDSVVNASVIEKAKRAVERAHNAIKSVETMENALARGKRKAVDVAEQEVIAAKRNRMITVLPEEMVEKTDTAGSAVATERIEDGAENSINSDKEGFDFVKLFEEDPPAENEPISPTSGNTSTQKSTDSGNKSVLSQQSVDMAPSNNNKLENIIEFVKLFDDDDTPVEGNEVSSNKRVPYTPNDDCECIFVTEVRKKSKGIPVVTIDDDNERREVVKGSPSTLKPECDYGPDTIDTQTPSTSYLPPLRSGDRSVTNNNNGHVAGEIDMEIEEDREEITVLSDDIGQRKSANTPHPYNGPSNMISLQRLKEMDLRTKLGVTIVASALDVYDTIKARRKRYQQGFDAFDAHIWRHYRLNGQDDRTFSWKMEVRERLLSLVKTVYEDANIVAVGSTVNGCGAYNSDMDLCLCLPDAIYGYDTDRDYGVRVLKKVFRVLAYQSNGLVRKCHCIPAKVPILKLEMGNEYSELEIDINCNNVAGIYNSHLLHYYARIDDRFPALCLLVKHWAINAGINDAMSGTFNSYSLILLVLHFLQCATMPPVLPNLQVLHPDIFNGHCGLDNLELFRNLPPLPTRELNRNTVGELLIAFFDYYAKFDFVNKAISIHRGCVFDRSDLATSTRRFKVFIEEPFDHENTARCVTRVDSAKYIKQVFIAARNAFLGASAGVPLLKLIDVH